MAAACDKTAYLTDSADEIHRTSKCHDDYDSLLAREFIDAVLIATPPKLHASMVHKALERGLHVFCEKPFVLDVAEGERLAALAETKGLVNQVGYHCRFVGAFQEAARIVKSGRAGPHPSRAR